MKKSTIWLVVGIASVVLFMIAGCCTYFVSGSGGDVSGAATADIDLEKLTKSFEDYVKNGQKDLNGFEREINDKSKGIYTDKIP